MESTRGTSIRKAQELLRLREGSKEHPSLKKVSFDELAEDFLRDYRNNEKRSIAKAERSVKSLSEYFGGWEALGIKPTNIEAYKENRLKEGYSNASVNKELAALKRAFNLGVEHDKINSVPKIKMLHEDNVREGFVEYPGFLKLMGCLPNHLKPIALFGYQTGWRVGEILGLKWKQIDPILGTVRIERSATKNKNPKTVRLSAEMKQAIQDLYLKRKSEWVFTSDGEKPVRDFRGSWKKARKRAGLEGQLFHDLRRSFAKQGRRAGVPETVLMEMGGWKTRSVFKRYAIVDETDLEDATKKLEAHFRKLEDFDSKTIADLVKDGQEVRISA